jgi:hypothetical protein
MFGRGSDPNVEQLRYNCSPAETRTGGDGVMNGPEGIAEMKKVTFTFTLSKTFGDFHSPATFNLTDRLTVSNTGNSLLTSHLYIPSVSRLIEDMCTVL